MPCAEFYKTIQSLRRRRRSGISSTADGLGSVDKRKTRYETFILSSADKMDLGMIYGRKVTVYILYISVESQMRGICSYRREFVFIKHRQLVGADFTKETDWRIGIYAPDLKNGSCFFYKSRRAN